MNIQRFLMWVWLNGTTKPTNGISDARWAAMLKWLAKREKEGYIPKK